MSTDEYGQAMESVLGKNFRSMTPALKQKVLSSRYGFDQIGIERNVSPLGIRKPYVASVNNLSA
jgi:hypothetical protein